MAKRLTHELEGELRRSIEARRDGRPSRFTLHFQDMDRLFAEIDALRASEEKLLSLLLTAHSLLQGGESLYGKMGNDVSWVEEKQDFMAAFNERLNQIIREEICPNNPL